MAKETIRVSATDAASSLARLLERVLEGAEVIIDNGERPVAVLRGPEPQRGFPGGLLSESIAMAEARGSKVKLDSGFAQDVEEFVAGHCEPLTPPAWD
jgi:antitoxin (DNA-binding transcriptional repressor) of toxin-antitoxin stability system